MRLKLRIDQINSRHVHCTIFSDPSPPSRHNGTFANLGKLAMNQDEYRMFVSALALGEDVMKGQFVLIEDPKFVEWEKREQGMKEE